MRPRLSDDLDTFEDVLRLNTLKALEVVVQDGCRIAGKGSLAFYKIGRGGIPLNGSAALETSSVLKKWTPIETEKIAAETNSTSPVQIDMGSEPLQKVLEEDLNNLQDQLASVRFVPTCKDLQAQ